MKSFWKSGRGWQPIVYAARHGHYGLAKFFLDIGADAYFVGEKNQNALDIARERGFSHIEQLLLNPQVKYKDGPL